MEISVDFEDGRIREFNTATFAAADPFKNAVPGERGARNFCTEFDLRLDLLNRGTLRLDIFYNTFGDADFDPVVIVNEMADESGERVKVPTARHRVCGSIFLLNEHELSCARYILVRRCGEVVAAAWRQGSGNWLIDGQRFAMSARQFYSDAQVTSRNAQELILVNYLRNAYPSASEEELCAMTGYPFEAFEEVRKMEAANAAAAAAKGQGEDGQDAPKAKHFAGGGPGGGLDGEGEPAATAAEAASEADAEDDSPDVCDEEPDSLIPDDAEFDEDEDE